MNHWPGNRWLLLPVIGLLIAACTSSTPTPDSFFPTPQTNWATTVPSAIPSVITSATQNSAALLPTPHPDTTAWVAERLDAVVSLYQPTKAGEALLRSLDLRQMEGEPGFFGSYGFSEWAGIGEAKPIGVIHELGHSYWGGFPVTAQPDLNWESPPGDPKSSAMQAYHQDILIFMAQPPDDYEILRQRLRNLPDVSSDNPEPVFHHLEADVPYTTGGSLNLVPPILRKYWDRFLPEGRFDDWYGAAGWFQSLTPDEVTATGKWLGFEHLDLRQYQSLAPGSPPD
ncbi:MAG: hypothetical protein H8E48_02265, partial [Chloroflexi bacterium]|nr:hypothetical protein [Chloroflexota bacterium]